MSDGIPRSPAVWLIVLLLAVGAVGLIFGVCGLFVDFTGWNESRDSFEEHRRQVNFKRMSGVVFLVFGMAMTSMGLSRYGRRYGFSSRWVFAAPLGPFALVLMELGGKPRTEDV